MLVNNLKTISFLANLEYKAIHRKKFFGIFWKFLNPLIFILIYTFVFSNLTSGGSRGFIISMGILMFSGISTSLNSSTGWVRSKLVNFSNKKWSLNIYFWSKIYFNFLPILYLLPVLIIIQRIVFNEDFKFSIFESLNIYLFTLLLTILTMVYCYVICIPVSILCKKFTDLEDLITHIVRISTYLSPILWTAKTGNLIIDTILQIVNPFYFIFEIMNSIIYRDYNFAIVSLVSPLIILAICFVSFFRKNKYLKILMESIYT